nr:immunoglobulin heavy chain junction region [Mus musculus]MBK4184149.1 immunoglobulin heavy chain junction region [Mus musculus]
CARGDGFFDFW